MKKLLHKIRSKRKAASHAKVVGSLRITNETVAEHRERILSGARRFKYPLHYPKHRIVFMTILIVACTVVSFLGICLWQLYGTQTTGSFFYRLTQAIPFPVANVDGAEVPYSDYLRELRSALHYLSSKESVNFATEDGKRQLEYHKRLALDKVIVDAYATKLAVENGVTVSNQELNSFIDNQIASNHLGVSQDVYRQVIRDYYDWSLDEYKQSVKEQLIRTKVAAKIDIEGHQQIISILVNIQHGGDFIALAKDQSEDQVTKATGGDLGFVAKTADDPNGLIKAAAALQPGQVSNVIEGVDGFYLVKLFEVKDDSLHFAKIFISYKTFDKRLAALKQKGAIHEFIKVAQTSVPSGQ